MRKVTIVIEKAEGNYSAWCLEVPGCVATGETEEEAYRNMLEALRFHLEGLEAENMPLPERAVVVREAVL